jgi:hypothetical protein
MTRPTLHVLTPTGAFRAWATVTMLIVGFGVALGLTIGYVHKVDRENERRDIKRAQEICEVATFIDDRQQKLTPTTEDQRLFYEKWHRFRVSLNCPDPNRGK